VRLSVSQKHRSDGDYINGLDLQLRKMTTEIRNWATVASAMEAQGATSGQMYIRAKALANGEVDSSPTSYHSAPFTILEVQ
jgi:hypothetical protein